MKKLSLILSSLLFLQLTLFAVMPYNLESIKLIKVLVIDQSGMISKTMKSKGLL